MKGLGFSEFCGVSECVGIVLVFESFGLFELFGLEFMKMMEFFELFDFHGNPMPSRSGSTTQGLSDILRGGLESPNIPNI